MVQFGVTTTQRAGAGAALAALAAAALWGTTGTAQALGPEASDPTAVGALRILVGALALVAIAVVSPTPTGRVVKIGRAPGLALMVTGGLAIAAYQVCFFLGVARAGVAVGTVVALGIAPMATGLLGMLLAERPTGRWLVATSGAVVGVVLLVVGSGAGAGGLDVVGLAAAAGAGVAYATYTITARALILRGMNGLHVMAGFFTLGAAVLLPLLLGRDLGWATSGRGLLMVLWLGLVATGVSYVLFQRGLAGLAAGTVATISLAEPVTATLLGVLVLGERLSPLTAVGIFVVVLSLLLVTVRRSR